VVTLEGLRIQSLISPRESFKQTTSKVAKQLLKQWPYLEHLIVEKARRKSSNIKSDCSSDDNTPAFHTSHISPFKKDGRS
jgi:hypothetical protein